MLGYDTAWTRRTTGRQCLKSTNIPTSQSQPIGRVPPQLRLPTLHGSLSLSRGGVSLSSLQDTPKKAKKGPLLRRGKGAFSILHTLCQGLGLGEGFGNEEEKSTAGIPQAAHKLPATLQVGRPWDSGSNLWECCAQDMQTLFYPIT